MAIDVLKLSHQRPLVVGILLYSLYIIQGGICAADSIPPPYV